MTENDIVFVINNLKDIEIVQKSGKTRNHFSVCYEPGDQYVYVLGGRDSQSFRYVNWVQKFDVHYLKWTEMPNMIEERIGAASFKSMDGKYLYAFGGKRSNVERILLGSDEIWQLLDVEWPDYL